jgi:hypothetical protein
VLFSTHHASPESLARSRIVHQALSVLVHLRKKVAQFKAGFGGPVSEW